jgi:hypothetical protein
MELNTLSPEQLKKLKGELAALSSKHADALKAAIFVGMNEKEADEYDQSRMRIRELHELLRVSG